MKKSTMTPSPGANCMGLPRWSWKPLGVKAFSLALETTNLGWSLVPQLVRLVPFGSEKTLVLWWFYGVLWGFMVFYGGFMGFYGCFMGVLWGFMGVLWGFMGVQ